MAPVTVVASQMGDQIVNAAGTTTSISPLFQFGVAAHHAVVGN